MPSNSQRLNRRQFLRNAEGYLELATVFEDRWPLPREMRFGLAQQAIDSLTLSPELTLTDASEKADVYFLRGLAFDLLEQYEQAAWQLAASVAEDPLHAEAYSHMAWCYRQLEDWKQAIESLRQELQRFPDNAIFYYNAACYSCLANQYDEALQYLLHALRLDSSLTQQAESEVDFLQLRSDKRFQAVLEQSSYRAKHH